ncbi:MAG: hypothetical protein RLZZ292_1761 [Bacteroidota bacterium]|jgi:hypothetical protein
MKKNNILISFFLSYSFLGFAQYSPDFTTLDKGIARPTSLLQECTGTNPSICPTYDVSGTNWTITGDADPFIIAYFPAVTERSYALSVAGNKLRMLRPNGDLCITSPVINIATAGAVSINLNVLRSGTNTQSTYISTNDRVFFKYILNGSATTASAVLTGGSGTNAAWNPSGITGSTLQVFACMSSNGFFEEYELNQFNVTFGTPLPITLSGFFAHLTEDNDVNVTWQTASERNNAYFEIERSEDGINFKPIGMVYGKGNVENVSNYGFVDDKPVQNLNYYRLKQHDTDGHFEYSSILTVNNSPRKDRFVFSPNPVSDVLTIEYLGKNHEPRSIEIYDVLGKLVYQVTNDLQENEINTSHLHSGTYIWKINQNGKMQTGKFLKI